MHRRLRTLLVLPIVLATASVGRAEQKAEKRVPVARSLAEDAAILRREAPGKEWHLVKQKEELHSGDLLILGPQAALVEANGAVRVTGRAELNGAAPFPVIETAVVLHAAKDVDLDLSLERGRIEITNLRKQGQAIVRIRIRNQSGDLVLAEPGTTVALEIYGRWPKGVPFRKDAKPEDGPALALFLIVLKGEAFVNTPEHAFALKAPPGPALLQGDGIDRTDPRPVYLEELPAWARGGETEQSKRLKAGCDRFRAMALKDGIGGALDALLKSDNPDDRRLAVYLMAATDDLQRLRDAIATAKSHDVWDAAVLAIRHWIGRQPGQDMILYNRLIELRKYTPVEAETALQLLHSFSDEDLAIPETYQTLIGLLDSDQMMIRGLAHWHLVRLVPGGKDLGYDPLAPKEARIKAIAAWRKHLPPGKTPADLVKMKEK
jgi:hypothetical protein